MFGARFLVAGALALMSISAQAREADFQAFLDPDPRVLDAGLYFHSSVPQELRGQIVGDLTWLAAQNNLLDTDRLGQVLGISARPLTGAHIVAWFLGNVSAIFDQSWCPYDDSIVISQRRADRLVLFRINTNHFNNLCANTKLSAAHVEIPAKGWRRANRNDGETDAFLVDRSVLLPRGEQWAKPFIWINSAYFVHPPVIATSFLRSRIDRLVTLVHEAQHINADIHHSDCDQQSLRGFQFGGRTSALPIINSCDASLTGPFAASSEFSHVLLASCRECQGDIANMYIDVMTQWGMVDIKLKRPIALDSVPGLAGTPGIAGKTLASVPPRRAFEDWLALIALQDRECNNKVLRDQSKSCNTPHWRSQVQAFLNYLDDLRRKGDLDATWELPRVTPPRTSPDVTVVHAWLRAASVAATQGYNVPLKWVPPCTRFADGCPN